MRLLGAILVTSLVLKEFDVFSDRNMSEKVFLVFKVVIFLFLYYLMPKFPLGAAWAQIPRSSSHFSRYQGPVHFPRFWDRSQGLVMLGRTERWLSFSMHHKSIPRSHIRTKHQSSWTLTSPSAAPWRLVSGTRCAAQAGRVKMPPDTKAERGWCISGFFYCCWVVVS